VLLFASLCGAVYAVRKCLRFYQFRVQGYMNVITRRQGSMKEISPVILTMHVSNSINALTGTANGTLLVAIYLTMGLAADILLSAMTGFFLLRSRNGAE